ncbi:MAG: hypothetical protein L0207_02395 [Chlamydiae bacterium]|nr:hypothetical protein [Chlamydiota bacterium]
MKKWHFSTIYFLLFFGTLYSLEKKPWFQDLYEFEFSAYYSYSRYAKVQNAKKQLKKPSNDQSLAFDLGMTIAPTFHGEIEMEFVDTPRQSWGYRTTALQGRWKPLDDILGDPVALTVGGLIREVSSHSLKDVSCPYSSRLNFEFSGAVGKEWSQEASWWMRVFGYLALGLGNRGAPWTRAAFALQGNVEDRHYGQLFLLGNFGFGSKKHVNVNHFFGWGKFAHRSIDIGAGYDYQVYPWGKLTINATYRLYARTFPEHLFSITIGWILPFSYF